jgi:hypothetical protein
VNRYRSLPIGVHHAERRLGIVTAACARKDDQTIEEIAAQQGCSPALVYKLIARTRDALCPVRPGPRSSPRSPAATTCPSSQAPVLAGVDLVALVSVLTVHHVSIRGIREVLAPLGLRAPGNSTLVAWVREAGAAARRLMARANTQLRPRVECLAGDDIFFHREAVKVLMEPVHGAVLEVLRWPDRSAESWQLWLDDWPAHGLFVSDLGTDLTGATDRDQRPHQADLYHEGPWWRERVFDPLSRLEKRLAKESLYALDRATRPEGPGRRLSAETAAKAEAARAEAEAQFFVAVEAEMRFRELFEPLDPDGRRWTDERIEDVLQDVCELLVQLPDSIGQPTWMHLYRHRRRWCAHRVLWDSIEVVLRDDATMSREQVLDAALAAIAARQRERNAEDWKTARAAQVECAVRESELASQCANAAEVMAAVKSLLRTPRRSSSLVEAFNSTLRVLQMLHRNVSDNLLGLHALAWNLRPRREGRRRGPSPYARLGVDFASDPRPWYAVLRDEMKVAT